MKVENQPQLPIPDVSVWMTRKAVAHVLGLSTRQVDRLINDGVITLYVPQCAPGERAQPLFHTEQIITVRNARLIAKGKVPA